MCEVVKQSHTAIVELEIEATAKKKSNISTELNRSGISDEKFYTPNSEHF